MCITPLIIRAGEFFAPVGDIYSAFIGVINKNRFLPVGGGSILNERVGVYLYRDLVLNRFITYDVMYNCEFLRRFYFN